MLSKHDELLLRDLKLQPLWRLWLYMAIGVAAAGVGFVGSGASLGGILCIGGGSLVALGAEKLVTRRIRGAAASLVRDAPAPNNARQPAQPDAVADDPSSARGRMRSDRPQP